MSQFTDAITAGVSEALGVLGTQSVTIAGTPYEADVDQFATERELDIEGFQGVYDASAFIPLSALSAVAAPIERTLQGKKLVVDGRTYRIERAVLDTAGVTLGLRNEQKRNPPLGTSQSL